MLSHVTFHFRLIRIHSNDGNYITRKVKIRRARLGKGGGGPRSFFAFLFTQRLFITILEPGTGYHGVGELLFCPRWRFVLQTDISGKYNSPIYFCFLCLFFLSLLLPKGSVYCFKFKICCFLGEPGYSCINKKTLATNVGAYFPTLWTKIL